MGHGKQTSREASLFSLSSQFVSRALEGGDADKPITTFPLNATGEVEQVYPAGVNHGSCSSASALRELAHETGHQQLDAGTGVSFNAR